MLLKRPWMQLINMIQKNNFWAAWGWWPHAARYTLEIFRYIVSAWQRTASQVCRGRWGTGKACHQQSHVRAASPEQYQKKKRGKATFATPRDQSGHPCFCGAASRDQPCFRADGQYQLTGNGRLILLMVKILSKLLRFREPKWRYACAIFSMLQSCKNKPVQLYYLWACFLALLSQGSRSSGTPLLIAVVALQSILLLENGILWLLCGILLPI